MRVLTARKNAEDTDSWFVGGLQRHASSACIREGCTLYCGKLEICSRTHS